MSIVSAKTFIEKMKTDEEFAKKMSECKDKEAGMAFVRAAGFDFTLEELDGFMREMTDDELEAVVGGREAAHLWGGYWPIYLPNGRYV